MAGSNGISGFGIAVATFGGLLMYAGIRDVPILEALRSVTGGSLPEGNRGAEGQPSATATAARAALEGTGAGGITGAVQIGAGGGFAQLAQAALRYKGRPYRWGATGPDAFDCSGLVQRAFSDVGISAPRTTYQQQAWRALSRIDETQMAAGDLVFWPGHVAIVVAAGTVIHAPRPGKVVEVVPVGSAGPRGQSPTFRRYGAGAAPSGGSKGGKTATPPKSAWV